jgi:repressor LexA
MNFQSLSERQRAIMKFIEKRVRERGYPPTVREIGEAVNINSTSVVNYNLNKLVKEGFITRSKKISRGIGLPRLQEVPMRIVNEVVPVQMVGQIVAGEPALLPGDDFVYAEADSPIPVPRMLIGNNDPAQVFALTVNGQSMIDAMIDEGDIVILKRQDVAHNGDTVAAWLTEHGETTLKRFFDEGERIRLQPANPTMQPIYVDKDKIQIQGKVLAVLRRVD